MRFKPDQLQDDVPYLFCVKLGAYNIILSENMLDLLRQTVFQWMCGVITNTAVITHVLLLDIFVVALLKKRSKSTVAANPFEIGRC